MTAIIFIPGFVGKPPTRRIYFLDGLSKPVCIAVNDRKVLN